MPQKYVRKFGTTSHQQWTFGRLERGDTGLK